LIGEKAVSLFLSKMLIILADIVDVF
jgi:hypothetical protein